MENKHHYRLNFGAKPQLLLIPNSSVYKFVLEKWLKSNKVLGENMSCNHSGTSYAEVDYNSKENVEQKYVQHKALCHKPNLHHVTPIVTGQP